MTTNSPAFPPWLSPPLIHGTVPCLCPFCALCPDLQEVMFSSPGTWATVQKCFCLEEPIWVLPGSFEPKDSIREP